MDPPAELDLHRERELFFKRTRKLTASLYICLGLGAVAVGTYACSIDVRTGSIGIAIGLVGMLAVRMLDLLIAISARATRLLIVIAIPLSATLVLIPSDALDALFDSALTVGIFAGGLMGVALGIALTRRRLARDDGLWLRQERLGFDYQRPFGWIRGESDGD